MYGITNQESSQIFSDPAVWDEYMAQLWYSLLHFCNINAQSTIIEVGPGTSTKIARSLAKMSFVGSVHLVEPHLGIGQKIIQAYRELLPKAAIFWYPDTLDNVIHRLPKSPGAIIGNHVLDDMLLLSCDDAQLEDFNWARKEDDTYWDDTEKFQLNWSKIKLNQPELKNCRLNVFNTWKQAIEILDPQNLLLSQYKSYFLSHSNDQSLDQEGWKIMRKLIMFYSELTIPNHQLQSLLNGMKNYNDSHIGLNVLNAKYWMVISKQ